MHPELGVKPALHSRLGGCAIRQHSPLTRRVDFSVKCRVRLHMPRNARPSRAESAARPPTAAARRAGVARLGSRFRSSDGACTT